MDKNIKWVTVKGTHIPIKKGETQKEAINNFFAVRNKFNSPDSMESPPKTLIERNSIEDMLQKFNNIELKEHATIMFKRLNEDKKKHDIYLKEKNSPSEIQLRLEQNVNLQKERIAKKKYFIPNNASKEVLSRIENEEKRMLEQEKKNYKTI